MEYIQKILKNRRFFIRRNPIGISHVLIFMVLAAFLPLVNAYNSEEQFYNVNVNVSDTLKEVTIPNCQLPLFDTYGEYVYVLCNGSVGTIKTAYRYTINDSGGFVENTSINLDRTFDIKNFKGIGDHIYLIGYFLEKWSFSSGVQEWNLTYNINNQTLHRWNWTSCFNGLLWETDSTAHPYTGGGSCYSNPSVGSYNIKVDDTGIVVLYSMLGSSCWCQYDLWAWNHVGVVTMHSNRGWSAGSCIIGDKISRYIEKVTPTEIYITDEDGHLIVYDRNGGNYLYGQTITGPASFLSPTCKSTVSRPYEWSKSVKYTSRSCLNASWSDNPYCGDNTAIVNSATEYIGISEGDRIFTDTGIFLMTELNTSVGSGFGGSKYYNENSPSNGVYTRNTINISKYDTTGTRLWSFNKTHSGGNTQVVITPEYVIDMSSTNLTIHNQSTGEMVFSDVLTSGTYYQPEFIKTSTKDHMVLFRYMNNPIIHILTDEGLPIMEEEETNTSINLTIQLWDDDGLAPISGATILLEDCEQTVSYASLTTNSSGQANTLVFNDEEYHITLTHPNYESYDECATWTFNQTEYYLMTRTAESQNLTTIHITTNVSGVDASDRVRLSWTKGAESDSSVIVTDVNGEADVLMLLDAYLVLTDYDNNPVTCNWSGSDILLSYCNIITRGEDNITLFLEGDFVTACFEVYNNENNLIKSNIMLNISQCNETFGDCNVTYIQTDAEVGNNVSFLDTQEIRAEVSSPPYIQNQDFFNFYAWDKGYCDVITMYLNISPTDDECYFKGTIRPEDQRHFFNNPNIGDLVFDVSIGIGTIVNYSWGVGTAFESIYDQAISCSIEDFNGNNCMFITTLPRNQTDEYIWSTNNQYYKLNDMSFKCDSELDFGIASMTLTDDFIDDFGDPDAGSTIPANSLIGYEEDFKENALPLLFQLLIIILVMGVLQVMFKTASGG